MGGGDCQTGREAETERQSEEKMNLRMSSYFSVLSPHFPLGGTLCCSVCCAVAVAAVAELAAAVVVVVSVWVYTGKSVPTLIRWLIRLQVREASAAQRGSLSEVRVRTSAATQLFIVLT